MDETIKPRISETQPYNVTELFGLARMIHEKRACGVEPLARNIHEGSSRKRADAKRDGHSEA